MIIQMRTIVIKNRATKIQARAFFV